MAKTDASRCEVCQEKWVVAYLAGAQVRLCIAHMPDLARRMAMDASMRGARMRNGCAMKVDVREWVAQERKLLLAASGT